MRCRQITCLPILFSLLIGIPSAPAQNAHETTLYAFTGGADGYGPNAGLVADAFGNLYGTTAGGGANGWGAVFELVPSGNGSWTENVIYSFQNGSDGAGPYGVILDRAGNLYGAATIGGTGACKDGCGTLFELSSQGAGNWAFTLLYTFQGGADGILPRSLILDSSGNLYGTTYSGGGASICSDGCGVVFELSPPSEPGGVWTESILHTFTGGADGANPYGPIAFDTIGNVYGTTVYGGGNASNNRSVGCNLEPYGDLGCGTVFKLNASSVPGSAWSEQILHRFIANGIDGTFPNGITFYKGGLYGTTSQGGSASQPYGAGTAFEITMPGGVPVEKILHDFNDPCNRPSSGVVFNQGGVFYSSRSDGGCAFSWGGVFEMTPPSTRGGSWTETDIYYFGDGTDGGDPLGTMLILNGTLYGTTLLGGDDTEYCNDYLGCGVVFSLTKP